MSEWNALEFEQIKQQVREYCSFSLGKELIDEYRKQYQTPMHAASCGMIDDVITPDSTRARIISALEILSQKLV